MRRIESQRLSDGVLVSYRDYRLMRAVVKAAEKIQGDAVISSSAQARDLVRALDAFNKPVKS